MAKKYRILRIVATGFQVVGWITVIVGILAGIALCLISIVGGSAIGDIADDSGVAFAGALVGVVGGAVAGVVIGLAATLYGIIVGFALIASGQIYYVFLDVEENTRETAMILRRGAAAPPQASAPSAPTVPPAPPAGD